MDVNISIRKYKTYEINVIGAEYKLKRKQIFQFSIL